MHIFIYIYMYGESLRLPTPNALFVILIQYQIHLSDIF